MKIGVLSGTFHPDTGGPATYLYHLLPELQSQGHEIRVLTYGEPFTFDYGYPVTRQTRQTSYLRRTVDYARQVFALARWADVLYFNGYALPLLALHPFKFLIRYRAVLKIVGDYSWEYAYRHNLTQLDVVEFQNAPKSRKLALVRAIYLQAVRLADDIIVPSEHLARIVRGWNAKQVQVIYNGIPEAHLYGLDRAILRRELNLPSDAPLLVCVARLTPWKGVHIAVEAMHLLPASYQMVVVGEGDQRPELEAAAPLERVHFVGRQEHENVLRYLRAADLFVLSSFTEGLSHVLLEAQMVGTPCVATDVGGNSEIISDGVNGLLVPPGDPPALAAAIRRVYDDSALAQRFSEAGHQRSQDFRWETTVNRTEALLVDSL